MKQKSKMFVNIWKFQLPEKEPVGSFGNEKYCHRSKLLTLRQGLAIVQPDFELMIFLPQLWCRDYRCDHHIYLREQIS